MSKNREMVLMAAALVVVTIVAYVPAMHGDFIWDDDDHVSNNQTLRSTEGLRSIWLDPSATPQYYPLVHTTFWMEYHLWGLTPTGYHVINILLHIAAAIVLWRVLFYLSVPGAWVIATIFAVHPVQVESVAWITERKNVLSGVLYLSAMLAYLHFALDPAERAGRKRMWLYVLTCILFVLALLSKTVTATLPAALLVLIAWKRGHIRARDEWPLLPLFLIGGAMGFVTAWIEKYGVGAQGMDWHLSPVQRLLVAGHAVWFYAGKLLWPTNLTFIYPRWHLDATDPIQLAYPISVLAVIVLLWLARRRIGSGPLVTVLLFIGTLVPALGFFDVFPMRYSFVADHFQYLGSIALIALAVSAAVQFIRKSTLAQTRLPHALAFLLITVFAGLTWRQCQVYASQETLWTDVITKDPSSWMGHTVLGALAGQRGDQINAERHYREAVSLNPDFGTARLDLGALLANQGRFDEAIPQMREDVRLEPNSLQAHVSLGRALMLDGKLQEAIYWLRVAMANWPNDPQARLLLEKALEAQNQTRPTGP
jgi:tetratricopeptide (TPR) repeat protein